MWHRILTLVVKELQSLLRDPQGRRLLIIPVLLQTALFPFAATLEVKNATMGVLNEDEGAESVELIQRFAGARAFSGLRMLNGEEEIRQVIDTQQALLVLRFPADFSRALESGRAASLQVILDGRRSNSGQISLAYAQKIVNGYLAERGFTRPVSEMVVRHRFNPNLDYAWFVIPSLVAIVTTISTLVVTALSIAREREHGTLDQLLVSPLSAEMIMIGKAVPALLVSLFQASIVLAAGVWAYRIPFQGSLLLLYGGMVFYVMALVGFGLMISSLCATQQQALLGGFSFVMPAVLLSGYVSPIDNMPCWIQIATWFNPLRHFIVIVKGVFLKDASTGFVLTNAWPLLVIALGTMAVARWMFAHRVAG